MMLFNPRNPQKKTCFSPLKRRSGASNHKRKRWKMSPELASPPGIQRNASGSIFSAPRTVSKFEIPLYRLSLGNFPSTPVENLIKRPALGSFKPIEKNIHQNVFIFPEFQIIKKKNSNHHLDPPFGCQISATKKVCSWFFEAQISDPNGGFGHLDMHLHMHLDMGFFPPPLKIHGVSAQDLASGFFASSALRTADAASSLGRMGPQNQG